MSEKTDVIIAAPSLAVGWHYIDNERGAGEPYRIHALYAAGHGRCHRAPYHLDEPREMPISEFLAHDARCLLCSKLLEGVGDENERTTEMV